MRTAVLTGCLPFYDDFDEADDASFDTDVPLAGDAQGDDDPPFDVEDDFDRKVAELGGAAPIRETLAPTDAEAGFLKERSLEKSLLRCAANGC